jgi:hypothetical protein
MKGAYCIPQKISQKNLVDYVKEFSAIHLNALKKRRQNAYLKLLIPLIASIIGVIGGIWGNELYVSIASGGVGGVSFIPVALDFLNTKDELDYDEFILRDNMNYFNYRAKQAMTPEEIVEVDKEIRGFRQEIEKRTSR